MSRAIVRRPDAENDFIEIYARLSLHDVRIADRFYARAELTLDLVARFPELGVAVATEKPLMVGLRKVSVRHFKKYLIYYIPSDTTIEVIRLFHGSRDIRSILEFDRTSCQLRSGKGLGCVNGPGA